MTENSAHPLTEFKILITDNPKTDHELCGHGTWQICIGVSIFDLDKPICAFTHCCTTGRYCCCIIAHHTNCKSPGFTYRSAGFTYPISCSGINTHPGASIGKSISSCPHYDLFCLQSTHHICHWIPWCPICQHIR